MQAQRSTGGSSVAVCTLWEGDYHKGVATLVNSLVAAGFTGRVYAGYRGALPGWAQGGTVEGMEHRVVPTDGVEIVFIKLATTQHFSQYKAAWCKRVLEELDPTASGVYYLDPDIFVLARWSFFEDWLAFGIASCEDSHLPLNPAHPIARKWESFATELGLVAQRPVHACQNSGLVGVQRTYIRFLDVWMDVMKYAHQKFALANDLKSGSRTDLFHNIDQDAFNVALSVTSCPTSPVGVDGMGFDRGEWLTVHATGAKPWRRSLFADLLDGLAPDRGLRLYWQYAGGPVVVESAARVRRYRWMIPVAALLSRFYHRW